MLLKIFSHSLSLQKEENYLLELFQYSNFFFFLFFYDQKLKTQIKHFRYFIACMIKRKKKSHDEKSLFLLLASQKCIICWCCYCYISQLIELELENHREKFLFLIFLPLTSLVYEEWFNLRTKFLELKYLK